MVYGMSVDLENNDRLATSWAEVSDVVPGDVGRPNLRHCGHGYSTP